MKILVLENFIQDKVSDEIIVFIKVDEKQLLYRISFFESDRILGIDIDSNLIELITQSLKTSKLFIKLAMKFHQGKDLEFPVQLTASQYTS